MANLTDLSITIDATQATEALAGLQQQADTLLATLKECKGLCSECKITIKGPDLVEAIRIEDYRKARTS